MPLAPLLPSPEGISYRKKSLCLQRSAPYCSHLLSMRLCVCVYCSVVLTLRDPVDCSLPGSSVHGILLARILEWVASSFSRGSV